MKQVINRQRTYIGPGPFFPDGTPSVSCHPVGIQRKHRSGVPMVCPVNHYLIGC
ncbi:MAG: hypothetical protein GF313_16720 [Caldithrix sp.]|nr:hypothetical protein [Caldithrix sp.]